ncbi:MAG: hypothetical protein MUE99_01505, partial [Chitinophagaceae bacterium]|nr:hypothetical protein [Chitinophagaceae bacterium]
MMLPCLKTTSQSLEYTENKGQWHQDVQFMGRLSSGALFLLKDGYKVLQYDQQAYKAIANAQSGHGFLQSPEGNVGVQVAAVSQSPRSIKAHAYTVRFSGANQEPSFRPEKQVPGYTNYFLGDDSSRWKGGVLSYSLINYTGVYRGVDL